MDDRFRGATSPRFSVALGFRVPWLNWSLTCTSSGTLKLNLGVRLRRTDWNSCCSDRAFMAGSTLPASRSKAYQSNSKYPCNE